MAAMNFFLLGGIFLAIGVICILVGVIKLVAENKELKLVLATLIPYMETSARIIKDLTGEDIPGDDAKYIEMAKELVK